MIVDVHTHFHNEETDMTERFRSAAGHAREERFGLTSTWERYSSTSPADSVAIVFGGKARRSGLWVEDRKVAQYVRKHSARTVGFLSVDPTQPGWQDELRFGHEELKLRGVKLMPTYAGFDPGSPALDSFWDYVGKEKMPVLMHMGTTFARDAILAYSRPVLADDVARRYPEQVLILAHLGHPYEGECIAVIRKNPNVYADISALFYRPFQFWHALMLAKEYGVTHKLLFGTDFPFTTVDDTVAELRRLVTVKAPGFDGLVPEEIEALIDRDALSLLGLGRG